MQIKVEINSPLDALLHHIETVQTVCGQLQHKIQHSHQYCKWHLVAFHLCQMKFIEAIRMTCLQDQKPFYNQQMHSIICCCCEDTVQPVNAEQKHDVGLKSPFWIQLALLQGFLQTLYNSSDLFYSILLYEAKLKMNLIYLLPADHQAGDIFAGLTKIYRH